jgi:hypothetical protein
LQTNENPVTPLPYLIIADEYLPEYDESSWLNLTEQGKKLTDKPTNQATARRGRLASLVQSTGSFSRLENTSNLLQNYTAVQKVLKAKFDDGLSNANTSLFYMSKSPKTFINAYEPPYKTLLAKNVNYFFNVTRR